MDRVLQYNFGYLPPRVGRASDAPLASLATDILGNLHKDKKHKLNHPNNTTNAAKNHLSLKQALDRRCVNYVRVLSAEMVQAANSGHPGAPMGCAPMAHVLWANVMRYDPADPKWINRDRFVLSNGHACALLYSMLHLTGYALSIDDLKQFRQLDSLTPGHPENHVTPGVEVSTGPLGQGISNAVGLAMGQAHLGATFNRENFTIFDNFTYVICGDGCMQEGIASEACSLAGHLQLGRLIVLYDDNKIQIDGSTSLAFTEDVLKRYEAYGWQTMTVHDGDNSLEALRAALERARADLSRPSLIKVSTTIGFGSGKQGTHGVHGAPLGHQDLASLKTSFGFPETEFFEVPADVKEAYTNAGAEGTKQHAAWKAMFAQYARKYPELAAEVERRREGRLPAGLAEALPAWTPADKALATRQSSQQVLNKIAECVPELIGGSADLTPSNLTKWKGAGDFQAATPAGRYVRFGVREHAMLAVCNGLAAYGLLRPFCATFLNFFGYAAGALRVSALSNFGVTCIATHDSIGLGEDGPTHQPVEALTTLRATPNLLTIRPADANEVAGAYLIALERSTMPTVIALSRQGCANLDGSSAANVRRGAYVLSTPTNGEVPQLVLVGTGSEIQTLLAATTGPLADLKISLVSMPCWELFDEQPAAYRSQVLPPNVPVLAVEALASEGWGKYAHSVIGMRTFGISAPAKEVQKRFGFTVENIAAKAREMLAFYQSKPVPNLLDRPDAPP